MKMYLLFDWTEERESKIHVGIFSTVEKAKAAAEIDYKNSGDHDDLEEGEFYELEWSTDPYGMGSPDVVGTKQSEYEQDYPYVIEEFEVDVYTEYSWGPGTDNPTKVVHQL